MKTPIKEIILYFGLTYFYAIIRYNLMGNVPLTDLPTYVLNKALSFTMVIVLLRIVMTRNRGCNQVCEQFKNAFKKLLLGHVLLSVILLSRNYYPKFIAEESFTLLGNLALLSGVIASVYVFSKKTKVRSWGVAILAGIHLVSIGVTGWLNVGKWYGKMPPITLLSFLFVLAVLIIEFRSHLLRSKEARG